MWNQIVSGFNRVVGFFRPVARAVGNHASAFALAMAVVLALVGGPEARAEGPDLTPVTGALTSTQTAILAVVGTVVGGGLALMAVKFGGRWIVRLWKSMTS